MRRLAANALTCYPAHLLTCPVMLFLLRYGDMRKTIGFKMRDMWYNLGESAAAAAAALMQLAAAVE